MPDKQPMSVAEVSELPSDSWINNGFTAVIDGIEAKTSNKTGKRFWKVRLADSTGSKTINATLFFAPKFSEGDTVDFLGQGLKFKTGQYGDEVSIGDKAEIHVVGKGHSANRHADAAVATTRTEAIPDREPSTSGASGTVLPRGEAVGAAMKESLALAVMIIPGGVTAEALRTPAFWADVKAIASNYLRVNNALCKGSLTPAPWATAPAAGPTPEQQAKADRDYAEAMAEKERRAAAAAKPKAPPSGPDEDVPF